MTVRWWGSRRPLQERIWFVVIKGVDSSGGKHLLATNGRNVKSSG
jgi:hypothetical protein